MALLSTLYPQRIVAALPVPFINLNGTTTVPYLSAITQAPQSHPIGRQNATRLILMSAPTLQVKDIPEAMFNQYQIGIQPVFFNKTKRRLQNNVTQRYRSYTMRSPQINTDDYILNRVNNIQITSNNQYVSLVPFLNNRFCVKSIEYRDLSGNTQAVNCIVPVRNSKVTLVGRRFPYSATYSPLYIAFRYYAISGARFFTGPLSPTLRVANPVHPFELDHYVSSVYDAPCAKLESSGITTFQCSFA